MLWPGPRSIVMRPALWTLLGSGTATATIVLAGNSVQDDASTGDLVGSLVVLNGSGTYTYSMTDTAGNRFQLDGVDTSLVEVGITALAEGSFSITIEADNGVDAVISQSLTVFVTAAVAAGDGTQWDFQYAANSGHFLTSGLA